MVYFLSLHFCKGNKSVSVCVCVCVCVVEFARHAASEMPVGGGVTSPDTDCLYCSVYYWQSSTQLSSDLWIGVVCICTQMNGCLEPTQRYCI